MPDLSALREKALAYGSVEALMIAELCEILAPTNVESPAPAESPAPKK